MWRCRCPQTLPADLLARRPDILAAQARIRRPLQRAAKPPMPTSIPTSTWRRWPASSRSACPTCSAAAPSPWASGPAIHLPIFDAGKINAQYASATADLDAAVADYNGAVVNAIKQTADAMTQVKSLAGQRGQQQRRCASAERAFKLAEDRYRSGLSTQIPMLTAEATLLQARQQLAAVVAPGRAAAHHPAADRGRRLRTATADIQIAKQDASP